MSFKLCLHISFVVFLFFGGKLSQAQTIQDACFYSINTGNSFGGSGQISNTGGCDAAFYGDNGWQGASFGAGAPYNCVNSRAIRISDASDVPDAVGFKLNNGLNTGSFYSFTFRVIKTEGNFSIDVYSGNTGNFYNGDGFVQAVAVTSQNGNYNAWTDVTVSFSATGNSANHNWIFLEASSGTGIIANMCQNGLTVPTIGLGPDEEICDGESLELDISFPSSYYSWSNGSEDAIITVGNEGTYIGTATNACGSSTDEIEIIVHEEPELNVTQDTLVCDGIVLTLEAPGWNASYIWSDGSIGSTFQVDTAGTYSVDIVDNCFTTFDEVTVSYLSPPEVDLGPDTAVCGGTVDYYVANGGTTSAYEWSNGNQGPGISIAETDAYSVTITNLCGSASDDVFVEFSYAPDDVLTDVKEFCEGTPMIVDASDIEGTFEWSDGQTSSIFTVPNPGWHYVTIVDDDSCFVVSDTIEVRRIYCDCPVHIANSFTPNQDGINEEYNVVFDCQPYDYRLRIYDRWGHTMFDSNNPNIGWSGRNKNGRRVPSAVYTYVLEFTEEFNGFLKVYRGSVTLIKD